MRRLGKHTAKESNMYYIHYLSQIEDFLIHKHKLKQLRQKSLAAYHASSKSAMTPPGFCTSKLYTP